MKRYFVTGTDTGVGKTFVGCALARRFRELDPHRRVFAYKPVETGVAEGAELGEDQAALVEAAGGWQKGAARGTFRFKMPAAPSVAARAEGKAIDLDLIEAMYRAGVEGVGLAIVEGAGGIRVPMTDDVDMGGVARRLALPVIIVARASLGTINHSILTIEAAARDGLEIAAVVLSKRAQDDDEFAESNAAEVRRRCSAPVIVMRTPSDLDVLLS